MNIKLTEQKALALLEDNLNRYSEITLKEANTKDLYKSLARIAHDFLVEMREKFHCKSVKAQVKRVHYLCMEFLLGRNLKSTLFNLGIDKYLILSKSEEKCGGRKRISNNACALEALFGAFYLAGKEKEIQNFIINLLNSKVDTVIANLDKYNAKEYLQEYTQMNDKHLPIYNLVRTSGPAHKPIFLF